MAQMPYMKMFWPDFFGDARVAAMSPEAQGIYLLLLGVMWSNGGWIAADDKIIARRLGLDVRVWRARYKSEIVPLLSDFQAPLVPRALTQKRLQKELIKAAELRAIRIANLGMSEAEYEANRTPAPDKQAKQKRAQAGHRTGTPNRAAKSEPKPAEQSRAIAHSSEDTTYPAAGRAAGHTERSGPPPHIADVGALPPREALQPMPTAEPEPASDPATVKRLVADGLKRDKPPTLSDLMAELTKGK